MIREIDQYDKWKRRDGLASHHEALYLFDDKSEVYVWNNGSVHAYESDSTRLCPQHGKSLGFPTAIAAIRALQEIGQGPPRLPELPEWVQRYRIDFKSPPGHWYDFGIAQVNRRNGSDGVIGFTAFKASDGWLGEEGFGFGASGSQALLFETPELAVAELLKRGLIQEPVPTTEQKVERVAGLRSERDAAIAENDRLRTALEVLEVSRQEWMDKYKDLESKVCDIETLKREIRELREQNDRQAQTITGLRTVTPNEDAATFDPIHRPAHYNQGSMEVWDAIEGLSLGFHAGNVLKYVARYKHKGGVQDLEKAAAYLKRLMMIEGGDAM